MKDLLNVLAFLLLGIFLVAIYWLLYGAAHWEMA